MRKTKIICTLGPATNEDRVLKQLMLEGMNVSVHLHKNGKTLKDL